jgi:hypothetical protein
VRRLPVPGQSLPRAPELRLYADGYLHALRRTAILDPISQRRLEELVDRWILDPSSFIGPGDDISTLYESGRN